MYDRLEAYKPAAKARTHLLLAALLWSAVGTGLLIVGYRWVVGGSLPYSGPLLGAAVVAGLLKAHFALRRAAARTTARIESRGDGRCIGGFLSLPTWGFVLLMMLLGYWLRHGLLPRAIVGLIYVAVGVALASASRQLWRAWYRHRAC